MIKNTAIILTPYFLDQHLPGLQDLLGKEWILNKPDLPKSTTQVRMSVLHAHLADLVEAALKQGQLPVSIAGDCCTAIGVMAGLQRCDLDPLLIWFDAHGDFNTWETSPSGFLGGMPLAMLTGRGEQTLLERLDVDPLPSGQVILSDARDLDPGEADLVQESSLKHFPDPKALLDLSLKGRPIWVHFDTDVVNSEQAPAHNYPAPGGLSAEELGRVFSFIADTNQIVMISVSSWNPELPGAEQTRRVSQKLIKILLQ